MTSSNGNIFRVTGPLCGEFTGPGEFPTQRPVTRSSDVFFDLRHNKPLSKQPWGWWCETLSCSLWRHHNGYWIRHMANSMALYGLCNFNIKVPWHSVRSCMTENISWITWWRHQMGTYVALLAFCAGNSPVTDEFPAQRPVTRSFDVFFDLRLNKRLGNQSWGWWFETPLRSLWRHCNITLWF